VRVSDDNDDEDEKSGGGVSGELGPLGTGEMMFVDGVGGG